MSDRSGEQVTRDPATAPGKPPTARGPAPDFSAAQLDRMSKVTQSDVDAAGEWWAEVAPGDLKGLLAADVDDGGE